MAKLPETEIPGCDGISRMVSVVAIHVREPAESFESMASTALDGAALGTGDVGLGVALPALGPDGRVGSLIMDSVTIEAE